MWIIALDQKHDLAEIATKSVISKKIAWHRYIDASVIRYRMRLIQRSPMEKLPNPK
jgi:hypothetical protein